MIPELGHFALSLALLVALAQAALPLYGAFANLPAWIAVARPAALAQLLLVAVAFACLTAAFISGDFSVQYVADHSNSRLPLIYRIAGVWGGHEGSLLLWSLILAAWSGAVAAFTRHIPDRIAARILAVLALISIGFFLFMLLTSNPFERLFPAAADGRDLNPLLQDIGLAVHPPMLYAGYVGFSVAFAFAVAALLGGRLDAAWARWARPWTNLAWCFLTVGIALGSWWAYYELGWGGWWFWDPVENASFMPWLAGTALLHSLAATANRGAFKAWTVLLAVCAFSLSLLGAFLVRSGVLTSVHAFATDPARGLFILIFLGIVVGGSLALYAWRAPALASYIRFAPVSREMALLINNVLFGALCFAVLTGTLYPLVLDALTGAKISVGEPYFNFLFAVIGAPLALFMGAGALLRWKRDRAARALPKLLAPAAASLVVGFAWPLSMAQAYSVNAALGLSLGCWVVFSSLVTLIDRAGGGDRGGDRGGGGGARWRGLLRAPAAVYGMTVAHLGVGVFIIGVTFTNAYSIEKDLRLSSGEMAQVGGYAFRFDGVSAHRGPNYAAARGEFVAQRAAAGGEFQPGAGVALRPEKRTYLVQKNPMTEAAIDAGLTRDLYVALGEELERGAWSVRIYYKPFIRWIWLGALLMAAGGLVAATDKRYRRRAESATTDAIAADSVAADHVSPPPPGRPQPALG
ncbi:MAG: heme lyase CcmF/NrfE family subunit [Gammaproteobacteria bacterium]|nr:heme lyase CcmF/NrfE family subunit [Gammaproteobacteria bacterium]